MKGAALQTFEEQSKLFDDVMKEAKELGTQVNSFTETMYKEICKRRDEGDIRPLSDYQSRAISYQQTVNERARKKKMNDDREFIVTTTTKYPESKEAYLQNEKVTISANLPMLETAARLEYHGFLPRFVAEHFAKCIARPSFANETAQSMPSVHLDFGDAQRTYSVRPAGTPATAATPVSETAAALPEPSASDVLETLRARLEEVNTDLEGYVTDLYSLKDHLESAMDNISSIMDKMDDLAVELENN